MIVLMIKNGVVEWPVSITPDQFQTVQEMYPEHTVMEQTGEETSGWSYDGVSFAPPQG